MFNVRHWVSGRGDYSARGDLLVAVEEHAVGGGPLEALRLDLEQLFAGLAKDSWWTSGKAVSSCLRTNIAASAPDSFSDSRFVDGVLQRFCRGG